MFCEFLPKAIRPKGLSTCCEQTLREDCTIVENCRLVENLKTTFDLPEFPKAVLLVLKHYIDDEPLCRQFEQFLIEFLQNIRIFTISNNLQVNVTLKTVQPKQTLGTATVDFHLQKDKHSFSFYVSAVRNVYAFEYLAEYLILVMKSMCSYPIPSELKYLLAMLLRAQTTEDIYDVLDDEKLSIHSAEFSTNVTRNFTQNTVTSLQMQEGAV